MKGLQLTKEGFEEEWWKMVKTGLPYVQAYHDLEEWHFDKFGEFRYASYSSFANIRDKKK